MSEATVRTLERCWPPAECRRPRGPRLVLAVLGVVVALAGCSVEAGIGIGPGTAIEPSPPVFTSAPALTPAPPAIPPDAAAPDTAGGLNRNRDLEATIPDHVARAGARMPAGVVMPSSLRFAFYHQPGVTAPNGNLLLLLGALTDGARTEQDALLTTARTASDQQGAPVELDLGAGTRGICRQAPPAGNISVPTCFWMSDDAFGYFEPLVPLGGPAVPSTAAELADLLRKLVPDLL